MEESPATTKSSIFIIEDDEPIGEVLKELLVDEGYDVHTAENGDVALKILQEGTYVPDLILLDLMMPVMDGVEFRKAQLKDDRLSRIPVVLMSADKNVQIRLQELKGEDCIKKPLSVDTLLQVVSKYC